MKYRQNPLLRSASVAAAITLAAASSAQSQTVRTWDGGSLGTGTLLNTAANWSGDTVPGENTIARWNGTVAGNLVLTLNASINPSPIGFAIDITSAQTGSLSIAASSDAASSSIGISNITIAAGAGAFTFGDGTGVIESFGFRNGIGNGSINTFTNNSNNTATLNAGMTFFSGGAAIRTAIFAGTGNWEVKSPLTTGSGSVAVTKNDGGTLILAAANGYTALTTVNGGLLNITSTGSLNSGNALTVGASGTANFANAGQTLGAVSTSNTATNALNFSASTGTITLASLAGSGNTRFGSVGTVTGGISTGTVTSVGALNANISGGTVTAGGLLTGTISSGTVGAGSLSSTSVSGGTNTITGAAGITSLSNGTTTVGGVATIGTMSAGTANLNGATSAITTLNGGTVNMGASTVLTVNDGTTSGTIAGSGGSLTKSSGGTLTLSSGGTYSYTGATNVTAGKLIINGNISTSTTTVSGTGTLGGSGTASAVTFQTGGKLAPGNSIGTLTAQGNVNFQTNSIFEVEIDTAASFDKLGINSAGNLSIASGAKLELINFGSANLITLNSRLQLIDYTGGTWNGGFFTFGTEELADSETFAWQDNTWRINYNDTLGAGNTSLSDGGSFVTLTAIPEPNTALLGGLCLLALLRRRRV